MMRWLPYVAALALIVPAGVVRGLWVGRWSAPEAFQARLERLNRIPLRIGDWTGRDVAPEAHTYERAGVAGGIMRRYQDSAGRAVMLLLVCGRPGPTSVHTPEVCYAGLGYDAIGERSLVGGRGDRSTDSFWTVIFRKRDTPTPEFLRIFHAWSEGKAWQAPSNPRIAFSGAGALYKMYVVRSMDHLDSEPQADPCLLFMDALLGEVDRAMLPPA